MPEAIQYVGLSSVPEEKRKWLDKLSSEYFDKISRSLNNVVSLKVHIKGYQEEKGKAKVKYSIHVQVNSATVKFTSTKATDWDFERTLHKAFEDVLHQIRHKIKTDDQKPKDYRKIKKKALGKAGL